MTRSEILFNLYEYRTGVFLVKAYVAGRSPAGRLAHVHHTAKANGLGLYGITLTPELARALQLVDALKPAAIAEAFRAGNKKPPTLPGLLSTKSGNRPAVIRHIHHRMSELLVLVRDARWPVTLNLDVRQAPESALLHLPDSPPEPRIAITVGEAGAEYRLTLRSPAGDTHGLIRYDDWKVITNHPTPGWLVRNDRLFQFGYLNGDHVKPFLSRDVMHVPPSELSRFWSSFAARIARHHPVVADGFDYREVNRPERLRISARRHPFEQRFLLHLEAIYGEKAFDLRDPEERAVTYNLRPPLRLHRILRDREQELRMTNPLGKFSLLEHADTGALVPDDPDPFAAVTWLLEHTHRLRKLDFEVLSPEEDGRIFTPLAPSIELSFGEVGDWLDLRGKITVGPHNIPFQQFVRYLQRNERCFPLPDGSVFLIPATWFTRYQPGLQLAKVEGNGVRLARSQAPVLKDLGLNVSDTEAAQAASAYTPGPDLKASLRPYQLAGVRWLVRHHHQELGACLADDMGLGKTLQTISVLLYAKQLIGSRKPITGAPRAGAGNGQKQGAEDRVPPTQAGAGPQMNLFAPPAEDEDFLQPLRALIILPASLVYNWNRELERFAPSLTVLAHTGTKRSREHRVLRRFDVILTTYQTALRDQGLLRQLELSYIVLDESQQIKNRQSKIFKAINGLPSRHRISLSGTPIENSLSDLWSQMQFINPGLLRGYAFFKREFIDPIEKEDDEARKQQLRKLVAPHLLRRTKAEVAPDLPPLDTQLYYCEMAEGQRRAYDKELSAARNALLGNVNADDGEYRFRVIQTLNRLRQLANHPALVLDEDAPPSGKVTEVLEQWETVRRSGQKVLIFSSMVRLLDRFREDSGLAADQYAWITGVVDADTRAIEVERFQSDERVQTFFISIKAGGTGLNLTAADYVFILDPWWNPSVEDQAIARAHRIGRRGAVFARKFITRGTIEEKINQLQRRKKQLATDILRRENKAPIDRRELEFLLQR